MSKYSQLDLFFSGPIRPDTMRVFAPQEVQDILAVRYRVGEPNNKPPRSHDEVARIVGCSPRSVVDALDLAVLQLRGHVSQIEEKVEAMTPRRSLTPERALAEQRHARSQSVPPHGDRLCCVVRASRRGPVFLIYADDISSGDRILFAGTWPECRVIYDRLIGAFPEFEVRSNPEESLEEGDDCDDSEEDEWAT